MAREEGMGRERKVLCRRKRPGCMEMMGRGREGRNNGKTSRKTRRAKGKGRRWRELCDGEKWPCGSDGRRA